MNKRKALTVSIPVPEMSAEEYIERQEAVIRSYRSMIWVSGFGFFILGMSVGLVVWLVMFMVMR